MNPLTQPHPASLTNASLAFRKTRALWWSAAAALALVVAFVLPGSRIRMGASQLNGLVGSYQYGGGSSGHGNWLIEIGYIGTANAYTDPSNNRAGQWDCWVNSPTSHFLLPGDNLDLSTVANSPSSTTSGGGTAQISALLLNSHTGMMGSSSHGYLNFSGAKMQFKLTWLPANDDPVADPPPTKVRVYYFRSVTCAAGAGSDTGTSGSSNITAAIGSVSINKNESSSGGSPSYAVLSNSALDILPQFEDLTVNTSNGTVTKEFALTLNSDTQISGPTSPFSDGDVSATMTVDFCVAGFGLPRYTREDIQTPLPGGGSLPISAVNQTASSDPSFTRWLPLSFSPVINNQPYRVASGTQLPKPWGNISCMYSMQVRQEPSNPLHFDASGPGLFYNTPVINHGSGYQTISNTKDLSPAIYILDANGEKVGFHGSGGSFSADPGVHSTLTGGGSGLPFTLSNAGPPGHLREKGTYTYTFDAVGTNPGQGGYLTSIQDNLGNQQSVSVGTGGGSVTDSSSGRQITFSASSGYITGVTAPTTTAGPGTYTDLTRDSDGHVTKIRVYQIGSFTPVRTDVFTYSGDGIATLQQAGRTASSSYIADNYAADSFGNPVLRISTQTDGDTSDSSSSDNGGSIAGTTTYHYGAVDLGYNYWGIDMRTNTVTDARGNQSKVIYSLNGNINDIRDNTLLGYMRTIWTYGPDAGGIPSSNYLWKTNYYPDISNPATITSIDPLGRTWTTNFDADGHVTSTTDPASLTYLFNWTGNDLTSIQDPGGSQWFMGYTSGRLTSASAPGAPSLFSASYNGYGQPVSITDPNGTTSFTYHTTTGDLLTITDPLSNVATVTAYDALGDPLGVRVYPDTGNPSTSTTPLIATMDWNADQTMAGMLLPNGVTGAVTYSNGVVTQVQSNAPAGGALLSKYTISTDSRGRAYAIADLVGSVAGIRYDLNSNPTRYIDGKGNTSQVSYNQNNQPTSFLWPGLQSAGTAYDLAGRVSYTIDERGQRLDYTYDGSDRVTGISVTGATSQNLTYSYDAAGRPLTISKANGDSASITYNTMKLPATVTTTTGGFTYAVSYTYNTDGSRATMTTPQARLATPMMPPVSSQASRTRSARQPLGPMTMPAASPARPASLDRASRYRPFGATEFPANLAIPRPLLPTCGR